MTALEHALQPFAELHDFSSDEDMVDAVEDWARRALVLRPGDLAAAVLGARTAVLRARWEWSDDEIDRYVATTLRTVELLRAERSKRRRAA